MNDCDDLNPVGLTQAVTVKLSFPAVSGNPVPDM